MITTYHTVLHAKKQLTDDVWLFAFALIEPSQISFEAGQYLILKIPGKGSRNYSIFSSPEKNNHIEMVIQLIPGGMASEHLSQLHVGDNVEFFGPGGKFVFHDSPRDKIFLATGTGIAPIKSMIDSYVRKLSGDVTTPLLHLFWGVKTRNDIYCVDDLKMLAEKHSSFTYTICLSREEHIESLGPHFASGRVNTVVTRFLGIQDDQEVNQETGIVNRYDYYICGGRDVVESVKQFVYGLGVLRDQVYFEKF